MTKITWEELQSEFPGAHVNPHNDHIEDIDGKKIGNDRGGWYEITADGHSGEYIARDD